MCSLITSEESKQVRLTKDGLTNLAKQNSNVFENVPFGDLKNGFQGSVSAEMLHISVTLCHAHTFKAKLGVEGSQR